MPNRPFAGGRGGRERAASLRAQQRPAPGGAAPLPRGNYRALTRGNYRALTRGNYRALTRGNYRALTRGNYRALTREDGLRDYLSYHPVRGYPQVLHKLRVARRLIRGHGPIDRSVSQRCGSEKAA